MDDTKPAPPRNSSRTLVIALVAVLVVVAIAGIVLAGLRGRTTVPGTASQPSATQQMEAAPTAVAPPVAAEAGAGPNQLAFDSKSDVLSALSLKKIADVAQAVTKGSHNIVVAARIEAGPDREQRMELAKKRGDAVRKALQAGGVSVNVIRVQISELPAGLVPPPGGDRLELVMK